MNKRPDMGAALASSLSLAKAARDEAKAAESEKEEGEPTKVATTKDSKVKQQVAKRDRAGLRNRSPVPKPPKAAPTPVWSKPKERYFNFRLPPEAAELLDDLVYVRKKSGKPFRTQELGIEALEALFRKEGLIQ